MEVILGPREKVQFYSKLQEEFHQIVDIGLSDSSEDEQSDSTLFQEPKHSYEEVKHNKPRPVQVRACDVENIKRVCEQNQLPLIKEYDFMRDT